MEVCGRAATALENLPFSPPGSRSSSPDLLPEEVQERGWGHVLCEPSRCRRPSGLAHGQLTGD